MTTPVAPPSAAVRPRPGPAARGWRDPRTWGATAAIALWVPGCAVACWWQVNIALSGDALGWAYSVMWPCFAVFGIVVWWQFVHDDPDTVGARGLRRLREMSLREKSLGAVPDQSRPAGGVAVPPPDVMAQAEAEDAELAEYNAYLASLADGEPKTWWRSRSG